MLPQLEAIIDRGVLQCLNLVPYPQLSYSPTQSSSAEQLAFAASRSENLLMFPFLSQYVLAVAEYTTPSNNERQREVEYKLGLHVKIKWRSFNPPLSTFLTVSTFLFRDVSLIAAISEIVTACCFRLQVITIHVAECRIGLVFYFQRNENKIWSAIAHFILES